ncbi:MAG: hypothetical protein IJ932_02575 [Ruminococcus sp.]|nr:hypothetical protein [Ruminococcus sp.]
MMKTRIKNISRRSLSTILAVLMLFSTLMVGTMITANAWGVQGGHKVYFVNTGAWSNVYHHFWGSGWNNWETMTQVANTGIYYKNYANDYTADGFNFMSSKSQSGGTSGRTDWVTSNVAYSGDNSMNYQTDLTKLNGTAKVVSMVSDGGSYTQSANANCVATISSKNLVSGNISTSNTSGSTGSVNTAQCYPAYGASVSYSASDSNEYVFMGFSTTYSSSLPNNATTSYSNKTSIGFNGGNDLATVYAYFKKRTTAITLNMQGGSGGTASVTATYGSDMPSATMPSKTGYTFAGYYDTSATSGGNMYYKANGSSNKTWDKTDATYTLYARWTQNNYSISSANASGTTSTMYNFTGTSTAHYQESPTFTLSPATGYKIDSITVKDASNNNVAYTKSSNTYTITSMPASNVTVTVSASIKTYTITLSETSATGGSLKVDNATFTSGSTVTHGSHTFRVDAPIGYEISSISGLADNWTINESYATHPSYSVTAAKTITVTYVRSSNPALNVRYIDASGSTVNASTGPITAGSAHYLEVTFTNQNTFTVGTSYSWNYTKNGTQQASGSGSTANSSSAITLKSWGAITAGTYVFTVTAGTKTKSITVNVNQSRKLTVSSVDHTTVSGSYTSEFGESKSITAAGEYWCNDGTSYTVTYTADSDYCFSSSSNNTTTSTDSGTISADHTATTPTVYEKKFKLTKVKYSTQVNGNTSSSSSTVTMKTVTGTDVASSSVAGHYVTSWQVTNGTVIVNGTSYTSSSGAQAITGNKTTYTLSSVTLKGAATVRFNYTERAYTLTMNKKVGSASAASIGTQSGYYVTTSTVTAPAITGYKVSSWQITTANTYFYIGSTGYNSSSGVQDITDVDTYTISNVNLRGNATIRFNYVENIYAVTVASATQGTKALGTVSPSSVNAGIDTNPSITATAKDGYEFTNWTGTNVTFANANSASTTVSATAAGTATANFRQTKLYLDISANSTWKGGSTISIYFFSNDSAYTSDSNYSTGYVTMEAVDGVENLYVGDIPSGFYDNKAGKWGFIFRYGNWTKQTADLQFDGNKNKYTLQNTETSGKTNYTLDNDAYFPPRAHTVSVGTITTSPHNGTSPGYTGDGGAVTVNNASSARISEHTNYAIKVSPTAGYKLTALAVNGTSIISGHENATSEFTINHAMGTGGESYAETITATFTAISYCISVSDNSSGNGGTIKYKKNGGTATATAGTATVEDRIQPVVTVNRTSGYKLTTVQLKNGSNVTQAILTNNGTEFSPSYSVYGMKAYNSKLEANFAAIQPAMASISTTTQGVSISGYTVNAYAGQTIAITPAVTSTSYGVISFEGGSMNMVSGVNNATKIQSGNTFTVTIPKNIGPNASSTAQYTFTITPKNSPAGVTAVTGAPQTITINVSYSGTPATNGAQQAYMNLKTMYDTYTEYGITDNDVVSGFTAFENARTAAGNTLGNFPTNLPAWNASAANYTSALSNLTTKYGELVFKTNTIYVLSQYSSDVKLHTYNRSGFFDTEATQVTGATQGDGKGFAMTLEGTTNSGKYLYSMTYQGKCDFTVYKVSGSTTVGTSNRISNNITLATTTNSSNIAYNTTT